MDIIKWLRERALHLPADANSLSDILNKLLGLVKKALTAQQVEDAIALVFKDAHGVVAGLEDRLTSALFDIVPASLQGEALVVIRDAFAQGDAAASGFQAHLTAEALKALGLADAKTRAAAALQAHPEVKTVLNAGSKLYEYGYDPDPMHVGSQRVGPDPWS